MNISFFKTKPYFIYIVPLLLFINCSESESVEIIDTNTEKEFQNVKYGSNPNQDFDIYLPKNRSESNTKILVLVHGGSWVGGDKKDMKEVYTTLKSTFPNYAIASINYQLAGIGKSPFPMQLNDIELFFNKLASKSHEYQISNKYGLIGVSAGAHLSMLYTYDYSLNNNINLVCSIVGSTNFTDDNYINNPDFANFILGFQLLTGVNYETNPSYYETVSPYHVVTSSAPPTALFYGGMDELVPSTQGTEMQQKLTSLSVINEFTFYENEGHGWEGDNLTDTYTKIEAFIIQHF